MNKDFTLKDLKKLHRKVKRIDLINRIQIAWAVLMGRIILFKLPEEINHE